jgi:transcriptional regulator with XRE-family HTH domain
MNRQTNSAPTFGDLLHKHRKARRLSLEQLAAATGLDVGFLSRIENGKRYPPDLPGILRLAKALGISEQSGQFAKLLAAADRARNPELHEMASAMRSGKPWNPFSADLMNEQPPVECDSIADLVARVAQHVITIGAQEITVKSGVGAVQRFRLVHSAKRKR